MNTRLFMKAAKLVKEIKKTEHIVELFNDTANNIDNNFDMTMYFKGQSKALREEEKQHIFHMMYNHYLRYLESLQQKFNDL